MKIVVCGSMRASREMLEIKEELIRLGHQVVLPDYIEEYAESNNKEYMHSESSKNKREHDLIREYYQEIKENDAILVANINLKNTEDYIGGNSFLEIGFAHILNKPIYLLNKIPEMNYRDEIEAMKPTILNGDLNKIK